MAAETRSITVETTESGLDRLVIQNRQAQATLYLQGAHLTSYQPRQGTDLLWVSPAESYQPGQAIRGGIPVCWPWFGAHPERNNAPSHGLVRTAIWDWTLIHDEPERTELRLHHETDGSHPAFPYRARVELTVDIGTTLALRLTTHNRDTQPLPLSQALHSYFPVKDLDRLRLHGLAGHVYFDKVIGEQGHWPETFRVDREIDRIVNDSGEAIHISQAGKPNIRIDRHGSRSVVVWNPWIDKSRALSNFNDDDYRHMLCLESANVGSDARLLPPGASHSLGTEIRSTTEPL